MVRRQSLGPCSDRRDTRYLLPLPRIAMRPALKGGLRYRVRKTRTTCLLQDPLRPVRQVLHRISPETLVSRWPAPANPPCRNAYSITAQHGVHDSVKIPPRTSILSISIFPYCFLISLFASFIASTVAIVFLRFSVAIAADSMLNDCCASWVS